MSDHTKMHLTNTSEETLYICHSHKTYAIPKKVAERYLVNKASIKSKLKTSITAEVVFANLEAKTSKAAVLLRGLRTREALSQVEFAKKINVTQANLSNMESGRRAIGKTIARRIEKVFGVDYRYFLE